MQSRAQQQFVCVCVCVTLRKREEEGRHIILICGGACAVLCDAIERSIGRYGRSVGRSVDGREVGAGGGASL